MKLIVTSLFDPPEQREELFRDVAQVQRGQGGGLREELLVIAIRTFADAFSKEPTVRLIWMMSQKNTTFSHFIRFSQE